MTRKSFFQDPAMLGAAMVFLCGILWGTIGPFIRTMGELGASVYLTSFLRMAFASAILAGLTARIYGAASFRVSRRTLLFCMPLGVIGMGVNCILYCWAVETAGISISAVLLNIAPVATAVMARLFFSETITGIKCAALAVNITGCVLTATGGVLDLSAFSLFGALAAAGSGLCYALCIIIARFSESDTNAYVLSTYSDFFAALFLLLFLAPGDLPAMGDPRVLFLGAAYAALPTALAYLLFYEGIARMKDTSLVPVIASMETVVAVLLGVTFYGDTLSFVHLTGIVLVLSSIALLNLHGRPRLRKKSQTV